MIVLVVTAGVGPGAGLRVATVPDNATAEIRLGVWGGDPMLRPAATAPMRWADLTIDCPSPLGWGRLFVGYRCHRYGLIRALVAAARQIEADPQPVLIAFDQVPEPVGVLPTTSGLWLDGESATSILVTDSSTALAAARALADAPPPITVSSVLESVGGRVLSALQASDTWVEPPLATLPNGIALDHVMVDILVQAIRVWFAGEGELPPDPLREPEAFLGLLERPPTGAWGPDIGWYWWELRRRRDDLQAAFPEDGLNTRQVRALAAWADQSWREGDRTPQLRGRTGWFRPEWRDESRLVGGVNLIGYHLLENSLGNRVRRLRSALEAANVPHVALNYHRTGSPPMAAPPDTETALRYDTNVIMLNADQLPVLDGDYGPELWNGRRTIGYWFWDVEYVPPAMIERLDMLDELWVATEWTAAAFRKVTDKPVRAVYLPEPEPQPSARSRVELGLPGDRFVFLVTFDYHSLAERKNPRAAIEAFKRAFPVAGERPVHMHVKTLNADIRPDDHAAVLDLVGGRPDIEVRDRQLDRGDQIALIGAADCLVSLHRSEGFGIHLLEAMWMRTPTVTTRYSGNLAFQNDNNAALVDCSMVPVVDPSGYFPSEASWAEPDVDAAASVMRRMVDDPEWRSSLETAGRRTAEEQPSMVETGRLIADLLMRRATMAS